METHGIEMSGETVAYPSWAAPSAPVAAEPETGECPQGGACRPGDCHHYDPREGCQYEGTVEWRTEEPCRRCRAGEPGKCEGSPADDGTCKGFLPLVSDELVERTRKRIAEALVDCEYYSNVNCWDYCSLTGWHGAPRGNCLWVQQQDRLSCVILRLRRELDAAAEHVRRVAEERNALQEQKDEWERLARRLRESRRFWSEKEAATSARLAEVEPLADANGQTIHCLGKVWGREDIEALAADRDALRRKVAGLELTNEEYRASFSASAKYEAGLRDRIADLETALAEQTKRAEDGRRGSHCSNPQCKACSPQWPDPTGIDFIDEWLQLTGIDAEEGGEVDGEVAKRATTYCAATVAEQMAPKVRAVIERAEEAEAKLKGCFRLPEVGCDPIGFAHVLEAAAEQYDRHEHVAIRLRQLKAAIERGPEGGEGVFVSRGQVRKAIDEQKTLPIGTAWENDVAAYERVGIPAGKWLREEVPDASA